MAFSIGANDAADGLGMAYGTKAFNLNWLIFLGAVAEFIGSMFMSEVVATTLSSKIIIDLESIDIKS